jgi:hypothetical protein
MSYYRKLRYERVMNISMGEYRVFISVRNLVVGLPLENCRNRNAWVEESGYSKYLPIHKAKNKLRYALGNTSFRELANNYEVRGLL